MSDKTIFLFDVPTNAGCLELGTEGTPKHLRNCGLIRCLESAGVKVEDLGAVALPEVQRHNDPPIRNFPSPRIVWEKTASFIELQKPASKSEIHLCLGGDCSIVVGTVSGVARLYDPRRIHILYLDGDLDSITPSMEKCVGSAGMGLWFLTNTSEYWDQFQISPKQITVIGNKEETSETTFSTVTLRQLRSDGVRASIQAVLERLPSDAILFVHFDVDVLSQAEMSAAYAPREQGLSFSDIKVALSLILNDRRLAFMEITEFVPEKDPDKKYGTAIVDALVYGLRDGTLANADDSRTGRPHIRPINPGSDSEIEIVATRMRETLMEVLGEDEGGSMYSMDWLRQRVLFHLTPEMSTAQIYVAESGSGQIIGHTIVRVEKNESGNAFGLFSTTFVTPEFRNQGIAGDLLLTGERWMLDRGLSEAATYTSDSNTKLISLYKNHGYEITNTYPEKKMIELKKCFGGRSG